MQRADPDHVRFAAQLQVQVPRNAGGDLDDGVAAVLERIDEVVDVQDVELKGLVPRLNDLAVDAMVEGRMRLDPAVDDPQAHVRNVLADGFGVAAVEQCTLRQVPEVPRAPVLEYG